MDTRLDSVQDYFTTKRMRITDGFYSENQRARLLHKRLPRNKDPSIPNGKTPIHQRLAPELLTRICNYTTQYDDFNDSTTLSAVRCTCHSFEKAAWPAFARSFNLRVFHPTVWSMSRLLDFASNPRAAPYLKTLHISTVRLRSSAYSRVGNLLIYSNAFERSAPGIHLTFNQCLDIVNEFREFYHQWESLVEGKAQELLRRAFAMLEALERIVVVEGDELFKYPHLPDFSPSSQQTMEAIPRLRDTVFDLHDHNYTMEVVFGAIAPAPNVYSHRGLGRISVTSIPTFCKCSSNTSATGMSSVQVAPDRGWGSPSSHYRRPQFPLVTRLDLNLSEPCIQSIFRDALKPYHTHLPAFLSTVPNLTYLNIAFPKSPMHGRAHPRTLLFGNTGFDPLTNNCVFPSLHTLQLANLDLYNSIPLQTLLSTHKNTLRTLEFTSLGLIAVEWTPFLRFLAREMDLDVVRWKSNLDPEEREFQRRLEERLGEEWRPEQRDWVGVARRTEFVGVDGEERAVARRVGMRGGGRDVWAAWR